MYLAGVWRYPVKSLAGESVAEALLRANGIPGDRSVVVRGPEGVRTSRRHFQLLGLHATLDWRGRALINVHRWFSAAALSLVRQAAGDDAWLEAATDETRFDILPLLVATDGAVKEFGRDVRRLRPDTVERDPEVLRDIGRRFGGKLALNAAVLREGRVRVGDEVKLVRPTIESAS